MTEIRDLIFHATVRHQQSTGNSHFCHKRDTASVLKEKQQANTTIEEPWEYFFVLNSFDMLLGAY